MSQITIYLKNMAGDFLSLETDPSFGLLGIRQTLSQMDPVAFPFHRIRLFREEDSRPLANGEILSLYIVESACILNHTTGTYICYYPKDSDGAYGYERILKKLMCPLTPSKALLLGDITYRHWHPDDKIVFVPEHLNGFVASRYAQIGDW